VPHHIAPEAIASEGELWDAKDILGDPDKMDLQLALDQLNASDALSPIELRKKEKSRSIPLILTYVMGGVGFLLLIIATDLQ